MSMHFPATNDDVSTLPATDGGRMTAVRRDDGFVQMIEQVDLKHEKMHARLRGDLDKLEEQLNKGLEGLRDARHANTVRIEKLETAPLDATKLVLNSRVVVTLVIMAIGIAASVWNIKSSISELASKMDTTYKLQEIQNGAMKNSIDEMKRRQELQQYEVQELKDAIRDGFAGKTPKVK